MSNFQQQLEEEIEKRGLKEPHDSTHRDRRKKIPSFSFRSFLNGIILSLLLLTGLVGWAYYNSNETLQIIEARLPSKTAIIAYEDMPAIRTSDIQPILSLGSTEETSLSEKTTKPAPEITQIEVEPVKVKLPQPVTNDPIIPINEISKNNKGMVPAPVPGLYENSTAGIIPQIRKEDGLTAFKAYKHPFIKEANKPTLSIIITDLGLSEKITKSAIEDFPDTITLAFSPYTTDLKNTIQIAREDGHETWLMLPLETQNFPLNDPGPYTLLSNANVEKNNDRLTKIMASAEGYVGFIPSVNHVFKSEDASINPSIRQVFERGLAIYDSKTGLQSFVAKIAAKEGYPYAKNDFWLDENLTPLSMNQALRKTIEHAEVTGNATLMLRPYPASIKALQKFLNSAAAQKFQLAPASAMVTYDG